MDSGNKEVNPGVQASENSIAFGNFSANNNAGTINFEVITHATEPKEDLSTNVLSKKFDLEPESVVVPAGPFLMGTKEEEVKFLIDKFGGHEQMYKNETPQYEVVLNAYRIGKYPVTNAQYKAFIDDKIIEIGENEAEKLQTLITPVMRWNGLNVPDGKDEYPIIGVTWYQALAYCKWLEQKTGREYQLPTEAQWEKASRGGENCFYPWGNEFDETRCNHGRNKVEPADPDRQLAQNKYGFDFVGNIRQWTCSLWGANFLIPEEKYSYKTRKENNPKDIQRRNDLAVNSQVRRVVRGSSFKDDIGDLRCSIRRAELPENWVAGVGFRVVMIL